MKINCDYCGKEIDRFPSQIKTNNYCSRQCYSEVLKIKNIKELNPNYRGGKYIKCEQCGKEIYRIPSMIHENNYCSPECRNEARKKRETVVCNNCGKYFEKRVSEIFWSNQRRCNNNFCCVKCQTDYRTIKENHPAYIADRSKLKDQNKSIRWSKEMCEWRKHVYERDNYTCQMCNIKSDKNVIEILNAHHIEKFSDNEKTRFDVDNGITLCENCHKLTYGKEEDFEKQFKNIIKYKSNIL